MLESAECDNIPKQFKQFQVDEAEVSFAKFNFVNRGISMFIYIYLQVWRYYKVLQARRRRVVGEKTLSFKKYFTLCSIESTFRYHNKVKHEVVVFIVFYLVSSSLVFSRFFQWRFPLFTHKKIKKSTSHEIGL